MNLNQIRTYIAWGLVALGSIPILFCVVGITILGIIALLCLTPALLVVPRQEMVFGHRREHTMKVEKGPWLS